MSDLKPPEDWRVRYEREQREREAAIPDKVRQFLARFPAIETIVAEYDGSDDGGQVESVTITPDVELSGQDDEELTGLLWRIAYDTNPGFEINEGGGGSITITRGAVTVEHWTRIESIETDAPVEYPL